MSPMRRDSVDDFDPNELIGRNQMAHGSPAPSRPPVRPSEENFELDFEPSPSQSTRQVPPEQVEALAAMGEQQQSWALEEAVEEQLDDEALGQDIDQGVAAELGAQDEDLPFDPDEARRFDAHMQEGGGDTAGYTDVVDAQEQDGLAVAGSYDPYSSSVHDDATAMNADIVPDERGFVEDDLDEADFYAGQGMYPEAMDALRVLLQRYPNHPLIQAKVREVQGLERGEQVPVHTPTPGHVVEAIDVNMDSQPVELSGNTAALELDEIEEIDDGIEEVSPDDFEEVVSQRSEKRKPSVMLERPVEEGDADTHYDLGLAYKEMGLFDEAAKAFEKAMRAQGREAQCRVMLGMCQREQGNPQEAIHQFKQGLHANPSERERLSLYYEIGITYESIGDGGEALYYFEAVTKRDLKFADAHQRADALRASGGSAIQPDDDL
jgi:tetratricopeptide (TPR) repeat protein